MKNIVVLSGSGISAESGISTFRDSGGLWEQYRIEDVCTYDAWLKNQDLVLDFYNKRRKQLSEVNPNAAHFALVELEKHFSVQIITQNVDNLHERAGSQKVFHLHGELTKSRSSIDDNLVYEIDGWELKKGDCCEKGSQLRPHIVWFGEAVPMMDIATEICKTADIFIVCGTSLQVYPAASLIHFVSETCPIYIIDPAEINLIDSNRIRYIKEKASIGLTELVKELTEK